MRMKYLVLAGLFLIQGCDQASLARRNRNEVQPKAQVEKESPQQTTVGSSSDIASTLLRVLANPQAFQGKKVQLIGFVHLEFEGNAIYLHREDFQYSLYQNSIWLSIPSDSRKQFLNVNNTYAFVEGTFNTEYRGHMNLFSGSIENITTFKVWATPKERKE